MYGPKKDIGNLTRAKKAAREERRQKAQERHDRIKAALLHNKENGITTSNIYGWELNDNDELIKV